MNNSQMHISERTFREWFHREHGPIDPTDSMARSMHRLARSWAHSAWIQSRAVALYSSPLECPALGRDE